MSNVQYVKQARIEVSSKVNGMNINSRYDSHVVTFYTSDDLNVDIRFDSSDALERFVRMFVASVNEYKVDDYSSTVYSPDMSLNEIQNRLRMDVDAQAETL